MWRDSAGLLYAVGLSCSSVASHVKGIRVLDAIKVEVPHQALLGLPVHGQNPGRMVVRISAAVCSMQSAFGVDVLRALDSRDRSESTAELGDDGSVLVGDRHIAQTGTSGGVVTASNSDQRCVDRRGVDEVDI